MVENPFTGVLEAGTARVCCTDGISLSYTALLRTQKSTGFESQSQSPSKLRKYLAKRSTVETLHQPQCHCVVLSFLHRFTSLQRGSLSLCYSAIVFVGTKDLKKDLLQVRAQVQVQQKWT